MTMDALNHTYKLIQNFLGSDIEPFGAVKLVEEYRQYWKPEIVKVVLLAESHVFTTLNDMDIHFHTSLAHYPTQYAKFVYCLAYGERQITDNHEHPGRDGTPQFWKLFYSCANKVNSNHDFIPILSKTPFHQRIFNKIHLLNQLREMGVWLIDTSITALYHKGSKPDYKRLKQALACSWENYTFDAIKQCAPRHIICIGKGVGEVVSGDLHQFLNNGVTILSQPNARLSSEEHMQAFHVYYRICREHCSV